MNLLQLESECARLEDECSALRSSIRNKALTLMNINDAVRRYHLAHGITGHVGSGGRPLEVPELTPEERPLTRHTVDFGGQSPRP